MIFRTILLGILIAASLCSLALAEDFPSFSIHGWTHRPLAALSNTVIAVKLSAGTLGPVICGNSNSSIIYVQVFDTSGSVTLGTDPPDWIVPIPPTNVGGISTGVAMLNGIKLAATTTATGSAAPSDGLDCSLGYN